MKKSIKQIKEEVIEDIKNLKHTGHYSKEDLINTFKSFEKEDFDCFGKDGNTYLTPNKYYNNLSKVRAKKELKSIMTVMSFHKVGDEFGVHLLDCCKRCKRQFLEDIFKIKCLNSL